jgi:hypothetical protein
MPSSYRRLWLFPFTAAEVCAACRVKLEYWRRIRGLVRGEQERFRRGETLDPMTVDRIRTSLHAVLQRPMDDLDPEQEAGAALKLLEIGEEVAAQALEAFERWDGLLRRLSPAKKLRLNAADAEYFGLPEGIARAQDPDDAEVSFGEEAVNWDKLHYIEGVSPAKPKEEAP